MKLRKYNKKFKYILIISSMLLNIMEYLLEKYSIKNIFSVKNELSQKTFIIYKGTKIIKSKILNDYLSKISDDFIIKKRDEEFTVNKFFNLSLYSDNPNIKYNSKKKLLYFVSKLKNRNIKQIDTFFIPQVSNFGNYLILINNCIY